MDTLENAIQSLLENESLTADLDDGAANILLDWGMARTRLAYRLAVDQDDIEGYLSVQMRATRKLMRAVNRWITTRADQDLAGNTASLTEVLTHAGVSTGPDQQAAFLITHLSDSPAEFISQLRNFCEGK